MSTKAPMLTPSVCLHNCLTTQGVFTQGAIETTQAVGLPTPSILDVQHIWRFQSTTAAEINDRAINRL